MQPQHSTQLEIIRQKLIKRQRSSAGSISKLKIPSISYDNLQNYSSSSNRLPMPSSIQSELTRSESRGVGESSCHWGKRPAGSMNEVKLAINRDSFLLRSKLDRKGSNLQVDKKRVLSAFRGPKQADSGLESSLKPATLPQPQNWMNFQLPLRQVNSVAQGLSSDACANPTDSSDETRQLLGLLAEEQVQVFDGRGVRFDKRAHLDQHSAWLAARIDRYLAESSSVDAVATELQVEVAREKRRRQRLLDRRDELLEKKFAYLDVLTIGPRTQAELDRLMLRQAQAGPVAVFETRKAEDAERLQMLAAYSAARQQPALADLFERASQLLAARKA